jgi:hypothetical protein
MVGGKRAGAAHVHSSKSAGDMTATEAAAHVATPATSHMATTTTTTTVATSASATATASARQGISRDGGCAKRDGRNQDDCLV